MKTQLKTLHKASRPFAMTVSGRKPVLALLMRLLLAAAFGPPVIGAQAAAVLTTLHSFGVFTNGATPNGLVQARDGTFYGTTSSGGTNGNYGTVFKISAHGALTTLYSFTGGNDGSSPNGLAEGSDGNFYGTTATGGRYVNPEGQGFGTVFKLSTNCKLTTLYSFTGGNDGAWPCAALVQGKDGTFYGTTSEGGLGRDISPGFGTVFKISTNGALTTLYAFGTATNANGQPLDGQNPKAALVQGSDGYLYGTTEFGGSFGSVAAAGGTVFRISTNGAFTSLYLFTGGNDGFYPNGLVQGSDGNFYGTTSGVNYGANYGTVFKISTNGELTTLHSFTVGNNGLLNPSGLVQGSDGYIYGTTGGGANGNGTVFRISANGAFASLYSFTGGTNGGWPAGGLIQGSDGYFYGTTMFDNVGAGNVSSGNGTVFKISSNGAFTSLCSFTGINDGGGPNGLVQGSDGSFYGTTSGGGTYGVGTVFRISSIGLLTTLYSFGSLTNAGGEALDGAGPCGVLVQGSDGFFYGTTENGGLYDYASQLGSYSGDGTVFKISTDGVLTNLHSFTGTNDGANPVAGLVQGRDGNFYGTTCFGGTNGNGTAFKVTADGVLTSLHSFTGTNDGANPSAELLQGSDDYFYGTTAGGGTNSFGTVFKMSASGTLASLYSFGWNDGGGPSDGLVQGSDGYLYGMTSGFLSPPTWGNQGTVFKISTDGVLTNLHSFHFDFDGAVRAPIGPIGALVQGGDGYFYGTTCYGGTTHYSGTATTGPYSVYGNLFKISTNGALTTLYAVSGNDGAGPAGTLVQGSDGNFYGTTFWGGGGGVGTVFRLTIVPDPQLSIIPSGPYIILSWPTNYGAFSYVGYTLQSTTNLVSPVWTTDSPGPVVIGGQNVVINTISGTQRFFRLSQ
jgi:uncharacterized repeat protein (TIGR03803 family)